MSKILGLSISTTIHPFSSIVVTRIITKLKNIPSLVSFLQSFSFLIPCLWAVLQVLSSHGYKSWAYVSPYGFPLCPSLLLSPLSSWKPRFLLQLIRWEWAGGAAQRRSSLCAHPGPRQRPIRGHQGPITQTAAHRELGDLALYRNKLFEDKLAGSQPPGHYLLQITVLPLSLF